MHGERYSPPSQTTVVSTKPLLEQLSIEVQLQAPPQLFVAGDVSLLQHPLRVAVVGSRTASPEGLLRARRLARLLARAGAVVVSGLAQGVDGAAHEAAIQAGGRTIAVIGTPLDRVFPREHARLQEQIYRDHLLVSQFPSGSRISAGNYIARNRTMALLCQASVIVEAGDTSGTLSQAAEVQRLGRPLFLMRSILDRTDLTWPARFIRNGAVVLERVEQILEVLADGSLGIRDDPLRAQPPALPIEAGSGRAQHA